MEKADILFKICIFGEGGVGKTSLTRRYLMGTFDESIELTMGANIFFKFLEIDSLKVGLQIWDFGGEEMYRFLLPSYAYGASGGIFMFDLTRYATLTKIENWIEVFIEGVRRKEPGKDVPLILVGGKKDLQDQIRVKNDEAEQIMKKYDLKRRFMTSSLTGEDVDEAFESLTRIMAEENNLLG